jgi:hypothetical protein
MQTKTWKRKSLIKSRNPNYRLLLSFKLKPTTKLPAGKITMEVIDTSSIHFQTLSKKVMSFWT